MTARTLVRRARGQILNGAVCPLTPAALEAWLVGEQLATVRADGTLQLTELGRELAACL